MSLEATLIKLHDSPNIVDDLSEDELKKIGQQVCDEYQMDKNSRAEWEDLIDKSIELAKQVYKIKSTPWEGAANVKFPLISSAAIQFAARTYPELIQDGRVVEAYISGRVDDEREQRAKRISAYMSYQLLIESDEWENDTDKLLHMLPVVGTVFRKTYYDTVTKRPCSDLCTPDNIVIHNSAKSIERARRISHLIYLYKNDVLERINAGIYRRYDLEELNKILQETTTEKNKNDANDSDKSYEFIEQHTFIDLDDDGYKEPYIVTVHRESGIVFRIVSRWDSNGVKFSDDGKKILFIEPVCYFTDYHFLPSFDGSFYSLGFGNLLYAINECINTVFNELLDAGKLSNLKCGFIGGGLRMEGGKLRLAPGEWKKIPTMGSDIASNVFPMPISEPSQTLFNLLQLLIATGKDLSGVIDILPDDQQTQNVPATTILSLLDQRLKPLKSIFKRIYRSFKKEFEKLYRLNSIYLPDEQQYFTVLNTPNAISRQDFKEPDFGVKPIADPSMASESQRIMKIQMVRGAMAEPGGQLLNPMEVMTRWINELNMPNPDKLIAPPQPPQPSPQQLEYQLKIAQLQQDKQKSDQEYQVKIQELILKQQEISNKKDVEEAKVVNLHAKSMLDIANAHKDQHAKTVDHLMGLIKLSNEKTLADRELDLQEQEMENDKLQSTQGVGGASGNQETSQNS